MKKEIPFAMILCLLFAFLGGAGEQLTVYNQGQLHRQAEEQMYVADQVIIKTRRGMQNGQSMQLPFTAGSAGHLSAEKITRWVLLNKFPHRIDTVRPALHSPYFIVETKDGCNLETLCLELKQEPLVVDASLNYIASITGEPPNDPHFSSQYALNNTGQVFRPDLEVQGTANADIKALAGWDWSTGGETAIIAVIDTGVAGSHEDLAGKMLPGYNYVAGNNNTQDDHGHGTFVASIAAANTNNSAGMAGVSWNSLILPVKVMDYQGYGAYITIGSGIRFAADQGAKVINLSVGGRNPSFILEDPIQYAYNKGCIIVSSTGNTGSPVLYPAAYDDYCLAIAATDYNDEWPNWSNYGSQVDVAAPGAWVFGAVYSPQNPDLLNNYGWGSGTSFSTPYVAGAAALLVHYKPFLTNAQAMDLIRFTCDDVNQVLYPGEDVFLGYGRINLRTLLGPYEPAD